MHAIKQTFILCILTPFLLTGQGKSSQELIQSGLKKYEIESGRIEYTIEKGADGTESFIFDRFGWRTVKKRNMKFDLYGASREQTQHEVTLSNEVYRIDHEDSTIQKRTDPRWVMALATMSPQQASESILFSLGGTHASDSIILDRKCQVWIFKGKTLKELWIWKGLVLKRKTILGENEIITSARKIETNIPVEEAAFNIPEVYKIQE